MVTKLNAADRDRGRVVVRELGIAMLQTLGAAAVIGFLLGLAWALF